MSERILLVDDEYLVVYALASLLKKQGYEVAQVYDGTHALPLLKEAEEYDLMLVDIRMSPVNGIELIRKARHHHPAMPIIVVSAYLDDEMIDKIHTLGVSSYIRKPFTASDILSAVHQTLDHGTPTAAAADSAG